MPGRWWRKKDRWLPWFVLLELHAGPDGFEQSLPGIFGLVRLKRDEREAAVAAIRGGDVQAARAGVSGFEVMDIIARGGKRADAARRHDLAAGLPDQEGRAGAGVESGRLAVHFEVTDARLAFHAHRAHAGLWMAVRREHRARRHAPLDHREGHSAKAGSEFDFWIQALKRAEPAIRRGFQ